VNEFVRQMVQEGYSQQYVLAAKKNFMKELILARSTPAAPAAPQRVAQKPAAQGGLRQMRLKDGRLVLVNSENRIVRVLN